MKRPNSVSSISKNEIFVLREKKVENKKSEEQKQIILIPENPTMDRISTKLSNSQTILLKTAHMSSDNLNGENEDSEEKQKEGLKKLDRISKINRKKLEKELKNNIQSLDIIRVQKECEVIQQKPLEELPCHIDLPRIIKNVVICEHTKHGKNILSRKNFDSFLLQVGKKIELFSKIYERRIFSRSRSERGS